MRRIGSSGLAFASWFTLAQASAAGFNLQEDFSGDPAARGWRTFGDASLFQWDADAGRLDVTWDSSRPNSYFHLPLGTTLRKTNEFEFAFTVRLDSVLVGTTEGKPYMFEVALGLLNFAGATKESFLRGTGFSSPNVVEWDYFPDSGFGATISSTIISEEHQWASSFNSPVPLETGIEYRFRLLYTPENQRLRTTMQTGSTLTTLQDVELKAGYDDFSVDTLAVMSYSDAGQDPQFAGSIRAAGLVDDLRFAAPPPPVVGFRGWLEQGAWHAAFSGRPDFDYVLLASPDLGTWLPVTTAVSGTGGEQVLTDPRPLAGHAFYRLQANRR
jgi:hypothetical protein